MILNGTSTTPTSSFPYQGIGPIDFSQLNFVETKETDFYYGTEGGTQVLLSQVTQTYNPALAFTCIAVLIALFFLALGFGIKKIRKMGK